MKDQFAEVLAKAGIFKQTTSPYSPQQSARAERYNLTIAEMVRTFLISSGLPKHLWPFAVLYAVYIKNRLPHSGIGGAITHELFYEKEVEYESIHMWGEKVVVTTHSSEDKFSSKNLNGHFVGVPSETKGCKIRSELKKMTRSFLATI